MPQLGETVTEGTITRWFKHVGDQVAENEPLFEVSTDKVDAEVPSPAAGLLREILVQEGATVDVGTVLARVGDAGSVPVAEAAPTPALEPAPEAAPAAAPAPAAPPPEPAPQAPPLPPPPAPAPAPAPTPADGDGDDPPLLSPVVRHLISENGLDPSTIEGTSAGGRITRSDVHAVIERAGAAAPSPAPVAAPGPAPALAAFAAPAPTPDVSVPSGPRDSLVPFSNIRRRTAEHMVRSKSTSAHALVAMEVDYHNVEKVRLAEKDAFKASEGAALTYLPFISRAVVDALRDFPELNASVGHDELIVHHDVHLGYAVDLDFQGLMVPVVHNADAKRLRALAREVADLAARARSKSLGPDDISGGTFTITNVGSYGTTMTFPVISQPQIAILSTDGVKKHPVVIEQPDGSDAIVVRPTGLLALAWDHRAVDGAYAAAFLRGVKEILETRDWRQELA